MKTKFILTAYINHMISSAVYDKLEDGSFSGIIPACKGVIAFSDSLQECQNELRSTLEEWIVLGLKLGHQLPVLDNINLNEKPIYGSMGTM
ncbi:MAG: type II toxin-antitoxin system HicB family antitoxin [Sphingobacteriaceae bacterium]|nr:type II toxin-antitoxin system HicB family antitoxin [Sphingobacteriaceae bacterium]